MEYMTIDKTANMVVAQWLLSVYYDNFHALNNLSDVCPDTYWKGRYKRTGLRNKALGLIAHDRVLNKQQLGDAFLGRPGGDK